MPVISYMTLIKSLNFSVPRFLGLYNGNNQITSLRGALWRLELRHASGLCGSCCTWHTQYVLVLSFLFLTTQPCTCTEDSTQIRIHAQSTNLSHPHLRPSTKLFPCTSNWFRRLQSCSALVYSPLPLKSSWSGVSVSFSQK